MDLFGSIPPAIWALVVIGFAFWYTFMRGKKKVNRKGLSQIRREEEFYKHQANITKYKDKIRASEDKARSDRAKRNKENWF